LLNQQKCLFPVYHSMLLKSVNRKIVSKWTLYDKKIEKLWQIFLEIYVLSLTHFLREFELGKHVKTSKMVLKICLSFNQAPNS
jgi:hypothetical protein